MKRIESLTKEQRARFSEWVEKWKAIGLSCEPADWDRAERGILAHYAAAKLPPPKRFVRVGSPLVCVLAGPIAAVLTANAVNEAVHEAVNEAVHEAVHEAVRGAVNGAVRGAVDDAVDGAVGGAVDGAVGVAVYEAVNGAVRGAVDDAVHGAVRGAVDDAVRGAVDGAVGGAVDGAVHWSVNGSVNGSVRGAVDDAVNGAVRGVVNGVVNGAVGEAVRGAVYGAVGRAVDRAVDGAVGEAVRGAVNGEVGEAVHGAVRGEVYEAVDREVRGEVGVAVDREVYGAVKGAVGRAVDGAGSGAIREAISRLWNYYNGGSWWCNYPAYATFFRDVMGCDIPIGPREDTDTSCGWWWPHKEFCIVSDRPSKIRMDDRGRLHSASGPAIEWRDGWSLSFWHGQNVPHEWITNPEKLDPELALNHENAEMRRCVAEILGWKRVLERLDTKVIDTDRDPEIGQLLEVELHGNRERFLKVRCGTGREFVLPVPPEMTRALEANAWTYGLNPGDLQLEART